MSYPENEIDHIKLAHEQIKLPYEPTASEINSYISARDGDITEEQAIELLKKAHANE